jgi:predicted HTH domain antitoxin
MNVVLPSELEQRLSSETVALNLAIGLLVTGETTLGQAAQIAGLPQPTFLRELGRRRIPLPYGPEELAEDLKAVHALSQP